MKKILMIAGVLVLCMSLALIAGCTQPAEKPVETPAPTPEPTVATTVATPVPTTVSDKPEPTQTLPDMWSLDVQVEGNGEAINPQVISTIRGGKGLNFILAVDVRVTRADGRVETGSIPRDGKFKVGDSLSLPVTSQMGKVNRVEVWATDPQGNKVKIFDDYVPFRTYN
jgi:D-serine deaminase-like pyridoxal phosphate-dependent protein